MGENWHKVENILSANLLLAVFLAIFIFVVIKYFGKYKKILFATAFPLFLFVKLLEDYLRKEFTVFDNTIYRFLAKFISKNHTQVMKFVSFLGSPTALLLITTIFLLLSLKYKGLILYTGAIIVNLITTSALNEFFKLVLHRKRPDILQLVNATGYSFPSAHSMVGISFYGLLLYFCYINSNTRYMKIASVLFFSILIFSIGISRIYLGVHYASDVLAGFTAGFAWLMAFIAMFNRYRVHQSKQAI